MWPWPYLRGRQANPIASLNAGRWAFTVGAVDTFLLRFAWANLATGKVSNAYVAGGMLGFALPQHRMWDWNRIYWDCDEPILRSGMPITLADQGDFYVRFAEGSFAGALVWVNPTDGSAASEDLGGYIQSQKWRAMDTVGCNQFARISSYATFH